MACAKVSLRRPSIGEATKITTIGKAKDMNLYATDSLGPPVPIRTPRILVADDDEGIRDLISAVLAPAGFNVHAVSDGQQAWEALLHEHYDLLVTDNEMPRLAGMALIKRIREAGMSLPVIIVSGALSAESVPDSLLRQIAAVLRKPFVLPELLGTVRQALWASWGDTAADPRTFQRVHGSLQLIR